MLMFRAGPNVFAFLTGLVYLLPLGVLMFLLTGDASIASWLTEATPVGESSPASLLKESAEQCKEFFLQLDFLD